MGISVRGSASLATSGTPRRFFNKLWTEAGSAFWKDGSVKKLLNPPPLAFPSLFQTFSWMVVPFRIMEVPPALVTHGSSAGKLVVAVGESFVAGKLL